MLFPFSTTPSGLEYFIVIVTWGFAFGSTPGYRQEPRWGSNDNGICAELKIGVPGARIEREIRHFEHPARMRGVLISFFHCLRQRICEIASSLRSSQ